MQPGDTISRYRIEGPLGRGGMGVVYKAEDLRLHRPVALKFLPEDSIGDADKQRFLNEARAAAAIRHPNVCPIHDIEDEGGVLFIAMAYLDGQTLQKKLASGPISIDEAVSIAIQVAAGLQSAHDLGIVHRDVKSANIMVNAAGHVSIMDFGLALRPDTTRLTVAGGAVGTPSYMSPEQVTGGALDHRTDIWSLGVLLYEMLTGKLPFRRDNHAAVAHAVLNEEPAQLSRLRPSISKELEAVVAKALAKKTGDRWQSCRQFAAELRRVAGSQANLAFSMSDVTQTVVLEESASGVAVTRRSPVVAVVAALAVLAAVGAGLWYSSHRNQGPVAGGATSAPETFAEARPVAVLPFVLESGGAPGPVDGVVDGVVDLLTTALADAAAPQGGKFVVVPTSEVIRRKIATPEDARKIYGTKMAVSGTATRNTTSPKKVDFVIRAVDTSSGKATASETFVFDSADPITSRDRAVAALMRLLKVDVAISGQASVRAGDSQAPAAYSFYLQARGLLARYDVSGNLDKAMGFLKWAVKEDPNYALAWAGLGEAAMRKALATGDKTMSEEAIRNAERAVQLDPSLAIVHAVLGSVYASFGHEEEAIREFQKAIEIQPSNAEAPRELARVYSNLGRFGEAEDSYRKAMAARPTDWYGHASLGIFYYQRERFAEAEAELKKASELTPDNYLPPQNLGGVLTMQGKYREAVVQFQRALKIQSSARTYAALGAAYFYQHLYADAVSAAETAIDLDSNNFIFWGNVGIYYRWTKGSEQKSKMALERAVELVGKYLETAPTNYDARADLAEYLARLGKKSTALAELKKIPLAAFKPRASRLALVYELVGQRRDALDLIRANVTTTAGLNQIRDDPDLEGLWNSAEMRKIAGSVRSR